MTSEEFRKYGHEFVDWMADYLDDIDNLPVKPDISPKPYTIKFLRARQRKAKQCPIFLMTLKILLFQE